MVPADITSELSRQRLVEVYMDACGDAGDDDPTAARCLIKAGNMLLARPQTAVSSAARGESVELDPRIIQQVNAAQRWLNSYTDQTVPNRQLEPSPTWRE